MSKRLLVWHIGAAQPARPVIAANLAAHHESLQAEGVQVAATAEEAGLATHELLRTHRAAGLSRSEVEGHWSRLCDRVWKHKGVSLLSTPDLCVADKDQIKLALDPLIGVEVHLVVTADSFSQQIYGGWLAELRAGRTTDWDKYAARVLAASPDHQQAERFWTGHDLDALLTRWGWTFRAERLHVVASHDVREHWRQFLDIARLPLDAQPAVLPAYADPAGVAVLRKVNRQLEEPLAAGSVELLTGVDREGSAMPAVPTATLRPLVERWVDSLAGHDLRGDLALLLDGENEQRLPGPRDQLSAAVDVLAEVLAENSRLRALTDSLEKDRDRLDRKRRKWKRLAKQASGGARRPRTLNA